ncbi:hypothetical protein [Mucilaginibacter sp.]|uniref:hypothetical protein n=1 Tax=Mucilaginibacter sp. TaxID=1882438 RepID=UPI0025EFEE35|nr:hypothetical protein [Mucilaginibacter sp.]
MLKNKHGLYHFLITIGRIFSMVLLLNLFFLPVSIAQTEPDYDEVSVSLNVLRIGNTEMPALVRDQTIYLPVSNLFDFLKIANTPSLGRDSLSGFFINQTAIYLIDKTNNRIRYKDKTFDLKPGDMIKTQTDLFLASGFFGKIFALNCTFSFRNLSVVINTDLELPVMREMRLDQMRNNISQLKGEAKVDTVVGRTYPLFHFGTADWSVVKTRETYFGSDTRVNLGLGGLIAGGETDVSINYHSTEPLRERDQYYLWRLANNDNPMLKQVMAGKIYGQSIASIYSPIVGVQLTNTPTTYRRSFGTYTISNITQPNWVVELYVNNVLVAFVHADASGYYTFEVPLVYGNSQIKLRFYGPSGEERSVEQNISVPFNFLPKNEFEYTASAGIVEDGLHSRFSRLSANYGLNNTLTIGGGTEYLSSVTSGATMPFINSSARLLNNLLLSGEYTYGVRAKAVATYRLNSGLQIELNDTWYKKGQTAINNTFSEERKVILSAPIRSGFFSAYTRFTLDQIILPATHYTTAEWLISGAIWNLNATINTYGLFIENNSPYYYSNLSISARVFKGFLFTQQAQYEYSSNRLIGFKEELERRFLKNGYLNVSYENNISSQIQTVEVGIRYDFSFAQTGSSIRKSNYSTRYFLSANGSLIADHPSKYFGLNNHSSVGKGGLTVIPFLDLNLNGKRDPGEPRVAGLKLRINGGRVEQNIKDTTIRITDLEPYINYTVELDPQSFDNISWQMRKHNFSVAIDPNKIKVIDVPITVSGEVSGHVSLKDITGLKGQGRIIVGLYRNNNAKMAARTITETDGYFTYLGLPPGDYVAKIDTDQLKKLNLGSAPAAIKFVIKKSTEGSIVDGLEFTLTSATANPTQKSTKPVDSTRVDDLKKAPVKINDVKANDNITDKAGVIEKARPNMIINPSRNDNAVINRKDSTAGKDRENAIAIDRSNKAQFPFEYDITLQVAHFKYINAKAAMDYLCNKLHYNALIVPAGHYYFNVRITGVADRQLAEEIIRIIKHKGFPDAYIFDYRRPPITQ